MLKLLQEFKNFREEIKNEINQSSQAFSSLINGFDILLITKENAHIIKNTMNSSKIMVFDQCEIFQNRYLFICLEQIFIIINENDFDLITNFFYLNSNSEMHFLSDYILNFFAMKIVNNNNILFKASIYNSESTVSKFVSEFMSRINSNKKCQIWNYIEKCFFTYVIEKYLIKQDRIIEYKKFFDSSLNKVDIKKNNYITIKTYSQGTSTINQLIYFFENGNFYILKSHQKTNYFEREKKNYYSVHHPFISKFYGTTNIEGQNALILGYVNGITLDKIIKQQKMSLTYKTRIIFQLLIVINYLHEKKFIYRDLKPNNIIIDNYGTLVLIDLDEMISYDDKDKIFSSYAASGDFLDSIFVAPELAKGEPFSFSADIFSVGMIIYFIILEEMPIFQNMQYHYKKFPADYHNYEMIFKKCTQLDEKKRPKISEIINDFYFNILVQFLIFKLEENTIKSIKYIHTEKYFKFWVFLSEIEKPYSIYKIGKMYEKGEILKKNLFKAVDCYKAGAYHNNIQAAFRNLSNKT